MSTDHDPLGVGRLFKAIEEEVGGDALHRILERYLEAFDAEQAAIAAGSAPREPNPPRAPDEIDELLPAIQQQDEEGEFEAVTDPEEIEKLFGR